MFVSNGSDEVASNEEQEVTTSNNGQETETQMTLTQELYAFVANGKNEEEQYNKVSSQVVQKDILLYEITKRRPSNLEKLYAALKTIEPTSVEVERAFSGLEYFVSKIRNCLKMILLLLCCFCTITIVINFFILQYNRLLYCFVNPEKSRNYVMEILGKFRARDFLFSPEIPSLHQTGAQYSAVE